MPTGADFHKCALFVNTRVFSFKPWSMFAGEWTKILPLGTPKTSICQI